MNILKSNILLIVQQSHIHRKLTLVELKRKGADRLTARNDMNVNVFMVLLYDSQGIDSQQI